MEGERRDDGRKKGDSCDQSGAQSRNMGGRHESRACWGHDRSVCVFAKLVVIRQGRVEGEEGRGVECETTWIRLSLREKKGKKKLRLLKHNPYTGSAWSRRDSNERED